MLGSKSKVCENDVATIFALNFHDPNSSKYSIWYGKPNFEVLGKIGVAR